VTPFQGDMDAYLDEALAEWRRPLPPKPITQPWPTPRVRQLETAMDAGFPSISGDTDPRTKELRRD